MQKPQTPRQREITEEDFDAEGNLKDRADKGLFNGACNRQICQAPEATWYNHSTRHYYCAGCALELNRMNATDPWVKSLGHALCTEGEHK